MNSGFLNKVQMESVGPKLGPEQEWMWGWAGVPAQDQWREWVWVPGVP